MGTFLWMQCCLTRKLNAEIDRSTSVEFGTAAGMKANVTVERVLSIVFCRRFDGNVRVHQANLIKGTCHPREENLKNARCAPRFRKACHQHATRDNIRFRMPLVQPL